ncbi:hypothetical protein [Halomonas elongata]|uniref:hypothetical protein n=1 Tax=Halomonas elongata TaxID=2746 RepID=UPI00186BA83C|nr:hypothetical protein [Halomonas elongata]MBW5802221.1 hypothetical protein [Halomonas elongata]
MKERPIIFSDEMVRAILDGRKTQTRRAMKPQPVKNGAFWEWGGAGWSMDHGVVPVVPGHSMSARCPYGQPGDRLWVREAWQGPLVSEEDMAADPTWAKDLSVYQTPGHCAYRASGDSCEFFDAHEDEVVARWRPSIHMPRWACRLLLEVTAVRVERLQDIGDSDAAMEGVEEQGYDWVNYRYRDDSHVALSARASFSTLWDSINGLGAWNTNPWVWVVEFQRVDSEVPS